jgi:hypothetical protein
MHNIKTNFDKILVVLKDIIGREVTEKSNYLRRGSVPKLSDIEVIAMSLTAECSGIDSESYLCIQNNFSGSHPFLLLQFSKHFLSLLVLVGLRP